MSRISGRVRRNRGEANTYLRQYMVVNLVRLFVFNSVCVMGFVCLSGLKIMEIPEVRMHYLMAQMVGQGVAVVFFIARDLFKDRSAVRVRRTVDNSTLRRKKEH